MALEVRRVVTGHDAGGKAIVLIDETARTFEQHAGAEGAVIWTTQSFPVDNAGSADGAAGALTWKNGTVFRVVSNAPGATGGMHRTESIDYAVVMSGELDMELDGAVVRLRAGDVLVQRGTAHRWVNRGSVPCVLAFVMIDARPVEVAGRVLGATV